MNYEHIIEAIYFQVMLLILVFITDLIYRQITNKEKENKRLFNKLELHFKELNVAHDQIEAKNDRLNNANSDLKNVNKQLAHSIAEFFTLQQISQAIGSILDTDELIAYVNDITLGSYQQVGMAMENADLYSEMHELAITDNLTGAYNRTYFHTIIKAEFIKAQKDCYEIAVAMLDIDNLKRVNDTYGHMFGDKVLKSIAALINKSIRSNDVMTRFGVGRICFIISTYLTSRSL